MNMASVSLSRFIDNYARQDSMHLVQTGTTVQSVSADRSAGYNVVETDRGTCASAEVGGAWRAGPLALPNVPALAAQALPGGDYRQITPGPTTSRPDQLPEGGVMVVGRVGYGSAARP